MVKVTLSALALFIFAVGISLAAHFEVLIINGDSLGETNEAPVIMSKMEIEGNTFGYTQLGIGPGSNRPPTNAVNLQDALGTTVNLADFDIVWLTWNGPGHDGGYFFDGVEADFLNWVEAGGFISMTAFDDNFADADGNQVGGWMPIDVYPLAVDNTGDSDVAITPAGESSTILSEPNAITVEMLNAMVLDDNFNPGNPDDWEIYATRVDNGQPALCFLPHGAGGYVELCVDARSTFPAAEPLVENMLHFMASHIVPPTAVEPAEKLTTTWGNIKADH